MGLFERKRETPTASAPKPEAKVATKASAPPSPSPDSGFGIQRAIELMRNLPADNIALVVAVVRTTLESTNIDLPRIIEDAKAKRTRVANRIRDLRGEIADFEAEISAREQEIAALEADGTETKMVQERFELAMNKSERVGEDPKLTSAPATRPGTSTASAAKPPALA